MRRHWIELLIILAVVAVGLSYLRPAEPPPETGSEALRHYNQGVRLYRQKEYQASIGEYSQALALMPDYLKAYRGRGRAWMASGSPERARADFEQGLARGNGPMDGLVHMGVLDGLQVDRARLDLVEGRYQDCLDAAEYALEGPDVAACARVGLGDLEGARQRLDAHLSDVKLLDVLGTGDVDYSFLFHLARIEERLGHTQAASQAQAGWERKGSPSPHPFEGPCLLCRQAAK